VPQPEPNIPSDNNKKTPPLSETEKNQKLEELKIKSADLAKKDNSKKPLSKEEKEQKIAEIEKQINKLEEEGGDENLKNILAKMKEQMGEVQRRLAEIKKNLKEVLESVKDYTSKLFNWFKSKNAKKITLQDNGELLVESNDGKSKTISVETIKNNEVLS
jgi:ABC-type transporter Mla subunit MlaD